MMKKKQLILTDIFIRDHSESIYDLYVQLQKL